MFLASGEDRRLVRTADVAQAFGISVHHLQKSVQGLVKAGYVEALQGRSGGVRLARPAAEIRLGEVVARLEGTGCIVDCARGPCPLLSHCALKGALNRAERAFVRELDEFTLADVASGSTLDTVRSLASVVV